MSAGLLGGDDGVVGVMTSGGTESCLMPVMAYRDRARRQKVLPLQGAEMVAPASIHVAWKKAARLLRGEDSPCPAAQRPARRRGGG